ncbi:unnamed protein product [Cylicostephanus goldi]|uniref:ERAP1-like C-terminal domain-containing protein n=1 Tax=Cylicostephanus goldi TaxID=71465 RepID=A0A3P7N346_CYLGO|nr:unnamed protein product [Cylicostephanus goldi]
MTRNGIISDAFAAALIGEVPYETIFNLIKYIKKEKEYLPWQEAINGFSAVLKYFSTEPEAEYAEVPMLTFIYAHAK